MAFDPDEFLKQEAGQTAPAVPAAAPASSSFDPDAFLANPANAVGGSSEPSMVAETAAPSIAPGTPMSTPPEPSAAPQLPVTGYGPGIGPQLAQTQVGQMAVNAGKIMQPYATAASKVLGQYASNPLTKLAPDLAAMAAGVPPPIASAQALGATQGAYNVARQITQGGGLPKVAAAATAPTPAQVAGNPMLSEMAARQAAAQAEQLANRSIIQKLAMSKVMQTAAPVLNTAGRIAGPAGMAYNMYEAGQMARDTQLGERLAQGQGQQAQQSFRQMNVPYGQGFTQTITADQARAVLASQNPRDIEAMGGMDFLRKKALGQ